MALTSCSGPPPSGTVPEPAGGGGGGGRGGGGGGGGRGGGGAAPAPQQAIVPHGNGKLEGKEPTIFPVTEQEPTNLCTSSNYTNSSTQMPHS